MIVYSFENPLYHIGVVKDEERFWKKKGTTKLLQKLSQTKAIDMTTTEVNMT